MHGITRNRRAKTGGGLGWRGPASLDIDESEWAELGTAAGTATAFTRRVESSNTIPRRTSPPHPQPFPRQGGRESAQEAFVRSRGRFTPMTFAGSRQFKIQSM